MKKLSFLIIIIAFSLSGIQAKKCKPGKKVTGYVIMTDGVKKEGMIKVPRRSDLMDYVSFFYREGIEKRYFTSDIKEFGYGEENSKTVYKLKTIPTDLKTIENKIQFVQVFSEGDINLYGFNKINTIDGRPNVKLFLFIEKGKSKISSWEKKDFLFFLRNALKDKKELGERAEKIKSINPKKIIEFVKDYNSR